MEKAVEVAKEDFATIRTGRANPPCSTRCRRLLRRADAAAAAGVVPDAGGPHDPGHPVRQVGRWATSSRRSATPTWASTPTTTARSSGSSSRAHRGAPPRVHQAGAHQGRGRQDLHPQHPPQGQGGARPPRQGRRGRRGRGHPRREGARAAHQAARRRRRRPAQAQGSRAPRGLRCPSPVHEQLLRPLLRRAPRRRPGPAGAAQPGRAQPAGRPRGRPGPRRPGRGQPVRPQGGLPRPRHGGDLRRRLGAAGRGGPGADPRPAGAQRRRRRSR